jgi:hypothetical protein
MKRDNAEKFAAIASEGVTAEQARRIVADFLAQIALCPSCEGSGTITVGRGARFPLSEDGRHSELEHKYVAAGTEMGCPRCSDGKNDRGDGHDPSWVHWICNAGDRPLDCKRDQATEDANRREAHADCGWRIILPLEAADP